MSETVTIAELQERQRELEVMLQKMTFYGHGQDETNAALHRAYWSEIADIERQIATLEAEETERRIANTRRKLAQLEKDGAWWE